MFLYLVLVLSALVSADLCCREKVKGLKRCTVDDALVMSAWKLGKHLLLGPTHMVQSQNGTDTVTAYFMRGRAGRMEEVISATVHCRPDNEDLPVLSRMNLIDQRNAAAAQYEQDFPTRRDLSEVSRKRAVSLEEVNQFSNVNVPGVDATFRLAEDCSSLKLEIRRAVSTVWDVRVVGGNFISSFRISSTSEEYQMPEAVAYVACHYGLSFTVEMSKADVLQFITSINVAAHLPPEDTCISPASWLSIESFTHFGCQSYLSMLGQIIVWIGVLASIWCCVLPCLRWAFRREVVVRSMVIFCRFAFISTMVFACENHVSSSFQTRLVQTIGTGSSAVQQISVTGALDSLVPNGETTCFNFDPNDHETVGTPHETVLANVEITTASISSRGYVEPLYQTLDYRFEKQESFRCSGSGSCTEEHCASIHETTPATFNFLGHSYTTHPGIRRCFWVEGVSFLHGGDCFVNHGCKYVDVSVIPTGKIYTVGKVDSELHSIQARVNYHVGENEKSYINYFDEAGQRIEDDDLTLTLTDFSHSGSALSNYVVTEGLDFSSGTMWPATSNQIAPTGVLGGSGIGGFVQLNSILIAEPSDYSTFVDFIINVDAFKLEYSGGSSVQTTLPTSNLDRNFANMQRLPHDGPDGRLEVIGSQLYSTAKAGSATWNVAFDGAVVDVAVAGHMPTIDSVNFSEGCINCPSGAHFKVWAHNSDGVSGAVQVRATGDVELETHSVMLGTSSGLVELWGRTNTTENSGTICFKDVSEDCAAYSFFAHTVQPNVTAVSNTTGSVVEPSGDGFFGAIGDFFGEVGDAIVAIGEGIGDIVSDVADFFGGGTLGTILTVILIVGGVILLLYVLMWLRKWRTLNAAKKRK